MTRKKLGIAVQTVLWFGLLWFVWQSVEKLPGRAEIAAFAGAGALEALAAFAVLFTLALVLRALRFGYLIRRVAPIGWREILVAFPWLFMIGAVTPFRLGDLVRAEWVRARGGDGPHTIGLWLAERATDMLCLVTLGLVGMALTPAAESYRPVLLTLTAGVLGAYVLLSLSPLFERHIPVDSLRRVLAGLSYLHHPREHLRILLASFVIWAVMTAAFWVGLWLALDQPVPLAMALLCVTFVNLAALISAAPGNIGSFQAAAILSLGFFGIPAETALLVSSALHAGGLGVTLCAGLFSRFFQFFGFGHGGPDRRLQRYR
ncbi:MAG: lysylphosphatidylglycerol synthase transmembrane domain-containing protein [Pseudomonadota bacterium]